MTPSLLAALLLAHPASADEPGACFDIETRSVWEGTRYLDVPQQIESATASCPPSTFSSTPQCCDATSYDQIEQAWNDAREAIEKEVDDAKKKAKQKARQHLRAALDHRAAAKANADQRTGRDGGR